MLALPLPWIAALHTLGTKNIRSKPDAEKGRKHTTQSSWCQKNVPKTSMNIPKKSMNIPKTSMNIHYSNIQLWKFTSHSSHSHLWDTTNQATHLLWWVRSHLLKLDQVWTVWTIPTHHNSFDPQQKILWFETSFYPPKITSSRVCPQLSDTLI